MTTYLVTGTDQGRSFWALVRPVGPHPQTRFNGLALEDIAKRAVILLQAYGPRPGEAELGRAVSAGWITRDEASEFLK